MAEQQTTAKVNVAKAKPASTASNNTVLESGVKAAIIAIGQGGYGFGSRLVKRPFGDPSRFIALNYKSDLRAAELVPEENRISINENSFGAGKNRNKSKADITQRAGEILPVLAEKLGSDYDVIFVTYSLDGGTGSAAGVIVQALLGSDAFPKKRGRAVPIIGVPIIPSHDVGLDAKINEEAALRDSSPLVINRNITSIVVDLNSHSEITDPIKRYAKVDEQAADLIYRFFCLNYLGTSNLDFEDRYVIESTPRLHCLVTFDPESGKWESPFLLPKGMLVNRVAAEIPEGSDAIRDKIISALGCTVSEKAFCGYYPSSSVADGAYPILDFAGFNFPEAVLAKVQGEISELMQKAEAQKKADAEKVARSFDMLQENQDYVEEQNSVKSVGGLEDILNCMG